MVYPEFIKEKDKIGITAVSNGIVNEIKQKRLDNAIKKFTEKGFKIIETNDVRHDQYGKSAPSTIQAKELEELYKNKDIKAIICAAGGDFLIEVLPYINFDLIKKNPKWIQGYSDPTNLTFLITTNLDIATIYASNICTFCMKKWHKSLEDNLQILKGNNIIQKSFDKYEKTPLKEIIGNEEYNLDGDVYWKIITNNKEIDTNGRIIGGCIDTISDIFGTKYDNTINFIEKYKEDGIIWYFDNAELTNDNLIKVLWRFKQNGWFQYTKCILFSRIFKEESYYGITYSMAIKEVLEDLEIPIVINCDFGHVAPRITIINGALANIKVKDGKGQIKFDLK